MKDVQEIRARWKAEAAARRATVLATLVETHGSTYRRPGARALFLSGASSPCGELPTSDKLDTCVGLLSGGCLEPDLLIRAQAVLESGVPQLAVYDLTSSDDIVFGLGLGCEGHLSIWLERVDDMLSTSTPAFLVAPPGTPSRVRWTTAEGIEKVFDDVVPAAFRVAVHGAGEDAKPLCSLLGLLGLEVHVFDRREGVLATFQSPGVVTKQALESLDAPTCSTFDALVLMSHHFESDARILAVAIDALHAKGRLRYVGCLGPAKRREKLFEAVPAARAFSPKIVRAPAGLDLGGDSPESIALAIAAEVHAVLFERPHPRALSERLRATEDRIHENNPTLPDVVVLAAGGARRFGSPKLLAELQGVPVLWHALDAVCAVEVGKRILVLGAKAEDVQRCSLDWCHAHGLPSSAFTTVVNAAWELGLSESLRVGLVQRTPGVPLLVVLADQPCVSGAHLRALLQAASHPNSDDVVASDYDGVAGVPAVFSPEAQERLLLLQGDAGARRLLNEDLGLRVRRVPFPLAQRVDVDTPDDIERALESLTTRP
jgi:xanthine dehydrogenase accessory factor